MLLYSFSQMYVTLELTFLSLMSAYWYWWKSSILKFENHNFTVSMTGIRKNISNCNLFRRFHSWWWSVIKKLPQKIKPSWRNFALENQAIWLANKISGWQGFPLWASWIGTPEWYFLPVVHSLRRTYDSWLWKSAADRKRLVPRN